MNNETSIKIREIEKNLNIFMRFRFRSIRDDTNPFHVYFHVFDLNDEFQKKKFLQIENTFVQFFEQKMLSKFVKNEFNVFIVFFFIIEIN